MFIQSSTGHVGVGATSPGARLHISGGSAAVTTQGQGLILRATDGTKCFLVRVNNAGAQSTTEDLLPLTPARSKRAGKS